MKSTKYFFLTASALLLSMSSCTDWLNQEPLSNVTTGSYFKNASEFKAAANNLYSQTPGYTNNNNPTLFDQGTDLSSAKNSELSGADGAPTGDDNYKNPYKNLRHVNNLLAQAEAYTGGDIDPYVGTAYFYRAFWHFFLLQRYGGVTLALEVPATSSDFVWGPRNSRYEVVSSILSDLNEAQKLLANTTKGSTGNDGSVTVEAVSAFKARVCLFEGTWEKYNGRGAQDVTNGDGSSAGAGVAMPSDYPSVEQLLTMAKAEAAKFVDGGIYANEYALWMECEDHAMDAYDQQSYYYLFALEEADSNPYGVTKASNNEAIFRKCFDYAQQVYGGANLTHSNPCAGSRKLMDMFLCSDGLPIHKSPLFQGYHAFDDEFKNRDARMIAGFKQPGHYYWCANAEFGQPAKYNMEPADDPDNLNGVYAPVLTVWDGGYCGRKYTQERDRATYYESADYMLIRLPEALLTYAEAVVELDGRISDADLDKTVNVIRQRAHIANLTNALVSDNGLDMKEEIRRERAIELFGEGFRRYDLCRWGIAEEELGRPLCIYYAEYEGVPTMLATEDKPNYPGTKIYDPAVWASYTVTADMEQSTYSAGMPKVKKGALIIETQNNRNFSKKNYLQAIPTDQIALNSELRQNPQW